jgi:hypothetical protein
MKFGLFTAMMRSHSAYICLVKAIGLDINFKLSNFWFWAGREGLQYNKNLLCLD